MSWLKSEHTSTGCTCMHGDVVAISMGQHMQTHVDGLVTSHAQCSGATSSHPDLGI
jgi:hypothetical protein